MKKEKLEQLTNEMVQILVIDLQEENATEDSLTIKFKHYNHKMLNGLIKESTAKYSLEWSSEIIRDEVYATIYEAMEIASKGINIEDMTLDNSEFMGQAYKLAQVKLKERLIPRSKLSRDGEVIGLTDILVSPISDSDDENANSPLENILAGQNIETLMGAKQEKMNHFLKWFDANKTKILTKKQINFLNGEVHHKNPDKARTMRKRISERVARAYEEQYGNVSPRIANLIDQERILEEILDAKSFRASYNEYKNEDFIIDAIAEHVNLKHLQAFNRGANDFETIRAMRVALYKKLGEVITMIKANE